MLLAVAWRSGFAGSLQRAGISPRRASPFLVAPRKEPKMRWFELSDQAVRLALASRRGLARFGLEQSNLQQRC